MRLHLNRVSTSLSAATAAALLLSGTGLVPTRAVGPAMQRHAAIPAEGLDMMPTGSAAAVERAKRIRPAKP